MSTRAFLFAALLALPLSAGEPELFPVYKKYVAAIEADDLKAAKQYVSSGKRARLDAMKPAEALAAISTISPKEKLRLHREVIDGDDATLIVVANVADNEGAGHIQLVREDGQWKILSELWNIGGEPDDMPSGVRQPANDKERAALRKLRERGFPIPNADFLVMTAGSGDLETLKLFVEAGYSVNTTDAGIPAIVNAASNGHGDVVLYLIEAGADVNAADEVGTTALMRIASKCDQTEAVRALLKAGAKVEGVTAGGANALQLAEWSECTANAEAIRNARQ